MNDLPRLPPLEYHEGTKNPYGSLFDPRHQFHPGGRPKLFKSYPEAPVRAQVRDTGQPGPPALSAIYRAGSRPAAALRLRVGSLARILHFSCGITKRIGYPPPYGTLEFRAAACTGALYHIELYVVSGEIEGLPSGVYHFAPEDGYLRELRRGDFRGHIIEAAAGDASLLQAAAVLVYTDVYWRNALKYDAREYRHAFWDCGVVVANSLAVAAAEGISARVVMGFVDRQVGEVLDLEPRTELPLGLLALGLSDGAVPPPGRLDPLGHPEDPPRGAPPVSAVILAAHRTTSFESGGEVKEWRRAAPAVGHDVASGHYGPGDSAQRSDGLFDVIRRRGSTRAFDAESISRDAFHQMLGLLEVPIVSDFSSTVRHSLVKPYFIVNAVEGIPPGSYAGSNGQPRLLLLQTGDFRNVARHLALDQDLGADAAVNVYFLADLQAVLDSLGDRGYRAAQMAASLKAGWLYLAAYSLRLGATGLTFYDDAVIRFFSPHAAGLSVMFLIAIGAPVRSTRGARRSN